MIYDLDDNPLSAFPLTIFSGETKTLTIRVECRTGYFLRSENVVGLTVEARRTGAEAWTNIETTPLDLSSFNGTRQNYEIRLIADATAIIQRRNFKLTVSL